MIKIIEKDESVNVVDTNNVFVGYSLAQCCCENAGYFISRSLPVDYYPQYDESNENDEEIPDDNTFVFDKTFIEYGGHDSQESCTVTFKMTDNDGNDRYLTLYNQHNGYYHHGFVFGIEGETTIESGSL